MRDARGLLPPADARPRGDRRVRLHLHGVRLVDTPDIGIAHFFYAPIALVAVATRPSVGFAAGVLAAGLYCLGVLVHPVYPSAEVLTIATLVRLVTFSGTGALVGWFARDNWRLVEELRILAERDGATGLPNTRAFEAAIQRRLDRDEPFALLIGDMAALTSDAEAEDGVAANDALIRIADGLGSPSGPTTTWHASGGVSSRS